MKHPNNLAIITLFCFSLYMGLKNFKFPAKIGIPPENVASIASNPVDEVPKAVIQRTSLDETVGWQVIFNETFEGSWPSSNWRVVDLYTDFFDRKWGVDNYRPHAGSKAAWPARGGANGLDPTPKNHHYFNNLNTRMIYGPFDLENAATTEVNFWLWMEMENCCDYLALEVSRDNITFQEVNRWSGTAGWQQLGTNLDNYTGYNSVWVSWRFYSNSSIVFDGPWIDDIQLRKFMPGYVDVRGKLSYYDRDTQPGDLPDYAPYTKVSLYDADSNRDYDDLIVYAYTDLRGDFSFPAKLNYDDDDPDDQDTRLDLYIRTEAIYNVSEYSQHRVNKFDGTTYTWNGPPVLNVPSETVTMYPEINAESGNLGAMWIFQDLRRAWELVYTTQIDPGSVTAIWDINEPCYNFICNSFFWGGPGDKYVFIRSDNVISGDLVVHETGHNYMYNANGWWYCDDPFCWDHQMFEQINPNCAWSEGWADYFPLIVNNDPCFDWGIGPCGIDGTLYYDLEAINREPPPDYPWGDSVEGRVAGSLYDLFDNDNEGYDSATFGFEPIADIVFDGDVDENFSLFWVDWLERSMDNLHDAVRALYQNTIDYDTLPILSGLPDRIIFENNPPWYHAIDLWEYSFDLESDDWQLAFEIIYNPDPRCGISLEDNRWINIAPQHNFLGSCEATIEVSDSLHSAGDTFQVIVVPVVDVKYLPITTKK